MMSYDESKKRLFIADDKSFIKCYDVKQIMERLINRELMSKSSRDQLNKMYSTPPDIKGVQY